MSKNLFQLLMLKIMLVKKLLLVLGLLTNQVKVRLRLYSYAMVLLFSKVSLLNQTSLKNMVKNQVLKNLTLLNVSTKKHLFM